MTRKPNRLRVGVIGLGTIGSRAAANLRAAGHQVYVWNRSPRAEPNFLGSAVEVTELCDALQLFVSDDEALLETVRVVSTALQPRHLVLAHPTVSPETAREAAAIVEKTGARYLDAPFTGSRVAAGNGELVYYVAGPEAARQEATLVLEATSKKIVVIGDEVGQAMIVKIATNLFTATLVQSLAEALALSRAAGIEPARFTEALEQSTSRSGTSDFKLATMVKGDYATAHFALKHMLKDTRLALRLAAEHGLTLPATATVTAQLYGADRRGWGEMDFAALAKNFDPAPPLPVPLPTVIPESLPPAPAPMLELAAPPEPPPADVEPSPPTSFPQPGLPPLAPVEMEKPAALELAIPRGGLPFPPTKTSVPREAHRPAQMPPRTTVLPVSPPGPAPKVIQLGNGDAPAARNVPGDGEPDRPPVTRRTLLSWFQRGK